MKNRISDLVTVNIESLNHSKHINSLLNNGIKLFYVKREYKKLTITVDKQNLSFVEKYFEDLGLNYAIIKYSGASSFALLLRNKIGLILGIVLSLIILVLTFNTVFTSKISPLEKVDSETLSLLLESEGVNKPFLRSKLDTKNLNEKISKIDGVALSSVYVRGCVLHIDINEELDSSNIEEQIFLPIIAERDCIIEQVIVERGTALVSAGQSVRKGDILIAPYFVFDENENITYPCEAVGEVFARVFLEEVEEYRENRLEVEKTGREERVRLLIFAGKTLGECKESKFENYEESRNQFEIFAFPFEILEIVRKETIETLKYMPFESVKTQIQEELFEKMYERVKKDVQIVDKWCIIRNNMGVYILTGVLEYIDSVGVKATENESG